MYGVHISSTFSREYVGRTAIVPAPSDNGALFHCYEIGFDGGLRPRNSSLPIGLSDVLTKYPNSDLTETGLKVAWQKREKIIIKQSPN